MMAPKLRSGSNVKSHNPGPHSPLDNRRRPAQPASASKAMRSRNQRQSGKNSRVAGQPDSSGGGQGEPGKPGSAPAQQPESSTFFGIESGYHEPRMRTNAPSFTDTPWSGVSHSSNPILGTMRPLGTLPTDADRIKVGLPPAIPKVKVVRGKKGVVAAEPQTIEPAHPLLNLEEIVASFLALPVPSSLLVDVEKVKSSIEDTLSLAVQCKNVAVARGLLHLWEDSNTDPFVLDVLASVMRDDPTEQEMSAFQSLLRVSWEEVQAQNPDFDFNGANGARRGSESSTSSLSSAKSLDAETFAPGMAPTDSSRPRRGGPGKTTIDYREGAGDDETGPDGTAESRKRLLDDESESEEMLAAKRQRMQKTFPNIVAHESTLRSSLASESPSAGSSPHPEASRRPGATPKTKTVKGKRTTGKRNLSASES